MGRIKKIQKHKKERDKLGRFKKTRRKEWRKKRRDFYVRGGSHTHVFSPSVENALEIPPLCDPPSRKPTCMGTSPYNIIFTIHMYFVGKGGKIFKITSTKSCHIFKFMVIVG
jgi:hypothetical protein